MLSICLGQVGVRLPPRDAVLGVLGSTCLGTAVGLKLVGMEAYVDFFDCKPSSANFRPKSSDQKK